MSEFIITTYDWVPELPRGYVRDLRLRWAMEEAQLPYRVESTPFHDRGPEHFAKHPFGQIPWLTHNGQTIFECGAALLYLGEQSEHLMPSDQAGRFTVTQWVFGALNSMEMASVPWSLFKFSGTDNDQSGFGMFDNFLSNRLTHLESFIGDKHWLTDQFSIADILMVDVLRLIDRFDGLSGYPKCRALKERGEVRPAFVKAHAAQLAHFQAADG